jgi:hypothetical protein
MIFDRSSIWRFGWVFHKLGGDPRPLFSPNVFYPHQLTLTYSDSMLLPALTTVPFLALGLHPVVAYNLVLVLSFIASAFAMDCRAPDGRERVVHRQPVVQVPPLPIRALQPFQLQMMAYARALALHHS